MIERKISIFEGLLIVTVTEGDLGATQAMPEPEATLEEIQAAIEQLEQIIHEEKI